MVPGIETGNVLMETSGGLAQRRQSFSERRRIQQRVAQRAYRTRKESDVAGLRKRLGELEEASERTSKALLVLCDKILASDIMHLYPQIGPALHICLSIAKSVYPDLADEEGVSEIETGKGSLPTGVNEVATMDRKTAISTSVSAEIVPEPEVPYRTDQKFKSLTLTSPPFPRVTDVDVPSTQFVSFPISEYLSYKENSTFSHYLVWTCFRNGYQLLTSPFTDPESIEQVFGPRFAGTKRQRMEHFLSTAISKLHTQLRIAVDSTTLQTISHQFRQPSHSLESGLELLDACSIQDILRKREITTNVEGGVSYENRSSTFNMRYFIELLSAAPICTGGDTVVFLRHRVEEALQLASVYDSRNLIFQQARF